MVKLHRGDARIEVLQQLVSSQLNLVFFHIIGAMPRQNDCQLILINFDLFLVIHIKLQ